VNSTAPSTRCALGDLREIDVRFVEGAMQFAAVSECWLITEEYEIVTPSAELLIKEATNSAAHRFVVDPQAFLEGGDVTG